MKNYYWW